MGIRKIGIKVLRESAVLCSLEGKIIQVFHRGNKTTVNAGGDAAGKQTVNAMLGFGVCRN